MPTSYTRNGQVLALAFQWRYCADMGFRALEDVPDELQERHPGSRWIVWRPTPRGPRWLVRLDFGAAGNGQHLAECIGIELRSFREGADNGWPDFLPTYDEQPAQLQRRTLRDVPLGQMLDDLGDEILEILESWAHSFRIPLGDPEDDAAARQDAEHIDRYVATQRTRKPSSRKGRGVPDLREIAEVYLDAKRRREPTTRAVAKWGSVSESTAAKWIVRVRAETNYLPAPNNQSRSAKKGRAR